MDPVGALLDDGPNTKAPRVDPPSRVSAGLEDSHGEVGQGEEAGGRRHACRTGADHDNVDVLRRGGGATGAKE